MTELIICILLGWLGIHKFIEGKTKLGLVYLFTCGLFGIGWLIDIIICLNKVISSKNRYNVNNTIQNYNTDKTNDSTKKVLVKAQKEEINFDSNIKSFIAFDLETTGLTAGYDKIIEVGFVKFLDGKIIDSYSALVKCDRHISGSATKINHITDEMLAENGEDPVEVFRKVTEFIKEAMNSNIPLVAHNASFDIGFLIKAFEEYKYECDLRYIDTLSLTRKYIPGLANYKLDTVAHHFDIINSNEHRACSDAETCGKVLLSILENKKDNYEQKINISNEFKTQKLDDVSREICAIILKTLENSNVDISKIRFYKNSLNYIDIIWIYTIMKFKISKQGLYMIMPKKYINNENLNIKECTQSEGGEQYVRVYLNNALDINSISDELVCYFEDFCKDNIQSDSNISKYESEFLSKATFDYIRIDEIDELVKNAQSREQQKQNEELEKIKKQQEKEEIKRQKEIEKQEEKNTKEKNKIEKYNSMIALQQAELSQSGNYSIDQIINICNNAKVLGKRSIIKLDDFDNVIKVYASVAAAAEETKLDSKSLRDVANGKNKHAGGFCWKYADDYIENHKK